MNQGHWQTGTTGVAQAYSEQNMEYNQDMVVQDQDMGAATPTEKPKYAWQRLGPDGQPIKRKPNPAKKNMMLRKQLIPKNSVMCLNEVHSGLKYVSQRVENIGNFICSVEVNEQTFSGYGSTKDMAKQAAAENALMSCVKPPPPKPAAGEQPKPEDDKTPWKAIASFAMYKLFTDWKDNKMVSSTQQIGDDSKISKNINDVLNAGLHGGIVPAVVAQQLETAVKAAGNGDVSSVHPIANISAHLSRNSSTTVSGSTDNLGQLENASQTSAEEVKTSLKPINQSKLNPEKLVSSHPVMILHQMCPQILYHSSERATEAGSAKVYEVSADINGQTFTGEGSNTKKAKFTLAKAALKSLYDIDNMYVAP